MIARITILGDDGEVLATEDVDIDVEEGIYAGLDVEHAFRRARLEAKSK